MLSQTIPTLATQRLMLRPPVDFLAYARLHASLRAKYMGGPFTQRAAWGIFCRGVAYWEMFGHGALMMDLPPRQGRVNRTGLGS
jgi:hypothetical protein